ncbi:MAG: sigma-70 family RNA polymerase sigma factor [Burkholderiaceae bacterium]
MSPTPFDYENALLQCSQGNRDALRQIYEREASWFLGVSNRIVKDRQVAEDVVQEAFVSIWTKAATFDAKLGSARGWMYTIVRHRALQEVRKSGHARFIDVDNLDVLLEKGAGTASETDFPDRQLLEQCLDGLEPGKRECIEAAFVEGYTHAELAQITGKPLGTIKSWIRRALTALRECLQ